MDVGASKMEKYRIKVGLLALGFLLSSCVSNLKVSDEKKVEIQKNTEFEKSVQIVVPDPAPEITEESAVAAPTTPVAPAKQKTAAIASKATVTKPTVAAPKKSAAVKSVGKAATQVKKRMPELEDDEGFLGRRPIVDPFQVGEVITHNVHYFKVSAGELKLKVEPHATVNGKKSYTLATEIKTSSLFNSFYSVDDRAVAYLDFETLNPHTYTLSVKESGQIREARAYFDFEKKQAKFWEKKITKASGEEEKRFEWEIPDYAQNVFSALFYMRSFQWKDDKSYSFIVSHDKENLVFSGKVIRREKISTKVGEFNALVIKPEFTLKGAFKPVGDIFIWLSDDERKYILRIESKIKIGTLVSEVIDIKPGRP